VISRRDGRAYMPILEVLGARHRRYAWNVGMACVDLTLEMSYGRISVKYETVTGMRVPRRTVPGFFKELAPQVAGGETPRRQGRSGCLGLYQDPGLG